ncbi:MAG: SRPBCC family protein [Pseudomonadota bacterium]
MRSKVTIMAILATVLAACSSEPPSEPIAWFDPPDLLENESDYVVSVASATVPMTPRELRAFLAGKGSLIKYMEPVGSIAPPIERTPISGTWPDEGARRRLTQADGHQLLERSLKNETSDFRYQAFGFTSSAGRGVDHIYADWSLTPVEKGTLLEWTYRVAPTNALTRIFVRRTRDNELRPFMQGTMDRMAAAALAAKASVEVPE